MRFFSTTEVAEMFKVNRVTIYRWIKEGKVDAYGIGKHFKVPAKEVNRLAREFRISGELMEEIQRRLAGVGKPAEEKNALVPENGGAVVVAVSADPLFQARLKETFGGSEPDAPGQVEGMPGQYRLAVFSDSLTAALEMGRERPGLLILDGATPGLDGVDLAKKIGSIFGRVETVFIAAEPGKFSPEYLKNLVQAGVVVVGRPLCRDVLKALLPDAPSDGRGK